MTSEDSSARDAFSGVTYDIREDEEQYVKLAEIVDLLVAAGYFRARIKGLPAFDKVVGGLVWCVMQCSVDVDVDLLYHENSTIGQKILLTEKIVRALPRLKCPHPIQPHQIQGLDFIHIFPVVQWLVKTVMEHQADNVDQNQAQGVWQYNKRQMQLTNTVRAKALGKTQATLQQLYERTHPARLLRRNPDFQPDNDVDRVRCALLEYGWDGSQSLQSLSLTGSTSAAQTSSGKAVDTKSAASVPKEDQAADQLIGRMTQASDEAKVDEGTLVRMTHVKQLHVADTGLAVAAEPAALTSSGDDVSSKQSELADCQQQITTAEELIAQLHDALRKEETLLQQEQEALTVVQQESLRLQQLEAAADPKVVEQLRALMNVHDEVKQKEAAFKQSCQAESDKMASETASLQSLLAGADVVVSEELRARHAQSEQQLAAGRLQLAAVNKQIASLQRHIDQVPSQAELNQYQRRFIELYNQMAAKHRETKQYYTLHNTLLDVQTFMLREIDLLESIYGVHNLASNSTYKTSFIDQMDKVHDSVRQNKLRLEKKLAEANVKRDAARDDLKELQDKQRLYYKTVNDFQQEMKRNEQLTTQIAELKKAKGIAEQ